MKRYKVIQNGTKGISTDFIGMTFRITISQFPTLDHLIIKRSHSIHMFSIQIDTKSFELVIYHQYNNIKLSFFASPMKSSFPF